MPFLSCGINKTDLLCEGLIEDSIAVGAFRAILDGTLVVFVCYLVYGACMLLEILR